MIPNFRFTKPIFAAILTFSLVAQILIPSAPARAQTGALANIAAKSFKCTFDAILGNAIEKGLGEVTKAIGDFISARKLLKEFFEVLEDNVPTAIREDDPRLARELKDCFAADFKRGLINAVIIDILEYVRNDNKSRFITDYKEEFKRVLDGTAADLVKDITGVNICQPFRAQFEIILNRGAFPERYRQPAFFECTLTEAIERQQQALDYFYDDFRYGGWDTWIRLHESPNNELGFLLEVNDQRILRVAAAREAAAAELAASEGFRSERGCTRGLLVFADGTSQEQIFSPPEPLSRLGKLEEQLKRDLPDLEQFDCTATIIITPGNIIADQTKQAVNAEFENLLSADSWFEIVKRIFSRDDVTKILREGLSSAFSE